MARHPVPDPGPLTQSVIRNVRRLRAARKLTIAELEERCRISRAVLINLENGRRTALGVDELGALANALRVDPWSLTTDTPLCVVCRNDAPPGFACLVCGQGRPGEGIHEGVGRG